MYSCHCFPCLNFTLALLDLAGGYNQIALTMAKVREQNAVGGPFPRRFLPLGDAQVRIMT